MQLETYLSDLLYRYECVTIPEFGAFLTQPTSASIDGETNTFIPPKKVISFNEQIQKNDGLLAHYIADVEKIPFEIANQKISKRVKILKSFLTQGETLTFKNIGELTFNADDKILFEPSYHLNYLTDAFGLSQFISPTVTREVYKKEAERLEKVIPIAVTPEKRKSKSYLKYAAVGLIALTFGGLLASNYYVNQIEQHNQFAQEQATQELGNKIQQATFNLNPLPAITWSVPKQSGNYHIVAGAFRIEENCNKKIKELKADGFNARKIGVNKYGLHEVVYGSYETGSEALVAIREIRKTHNKDAWIKVDSETSKNLSKKNNSLQLQKADNKVIAPLKTEALKSNTSSNFDLEVSPNIIKIINNVDDSVEKGYYLILGTYTETSKRDVFITELKSKGLTNIGFFFDKVSHNYFVYNKKFNDLETAKKTLLSKENLPYKGKMAIVKVEN